MKQIFLLAIFIIFSQAALAQTKIDEYDWAADDDEHARLYHFSNELKNKPEAKGYVIIHKPEDWGTGKFLRRFYGAKRVLTDFMDVNSERLKFVAGEERKKMLRAFWLVSDNEKFPDYKTISLEDKLAEKITKRTLFDFDCVGCDPAVALDFYIFREGLDYYAQALKANPNAKALILVGKNGYLAKTRKERKELTDEIIRGLVENNQIQQNRIEIKFVSGDFAYFYIVPPKIN